MPDRLVDDAPLTWFRFDVLKLHHAALSRAAWAVLQPWEVGTTIEDLLAALQHLRATLAASPIRCACAPSGSGGDWCTGHCFSPSDRRRHDDPSLP